MIYKYSILLLLANTISGISIDGIYNKFNPAQLLFQKSDNKYSEHQNLFKSKEIYHQCPIDIPISCSNETYVEDSCCFEYPGGVLLQTQFWDYYPAVGPDDLFTLHGLWPDNCDGSFDQFCDPSSEISSVTKILEEFKEDELLTKMKRIWKNYNGNDENLWVHEYNKHGTCMTTINPKCYNPSTFKKNQNVVDFYKKTVELFEQLPTYQWLALNGIVPSETQTYTKKQIEDTLSAHFGQPVYIKCNRYRAFQEVWYFYHLKGSIVNGDYYPIPAMMNSQCPEEGIKFLPKGFKPGPSPPNPNPTHTRPGLPKPTGTGLRGFIKPEGYSGCLISNGKWYSSGTCATYTLYKAEFGGYNLKTSKGYCSIGKEGFLICGPSIKPMQFSYDKEKKLVYFGGKLSWSATEQPTRFKQVPVYPGYDNNLKFKLHLEIH